MSRKNCSRGSSIAFAAVAAVAGFAVAAPALAQEDRIIVTAPPYTVQREVERDARGVPTESVSATQVVSAQGLDLRYEGDVAELNRRVAYAAMLACEEAEDWLPNSLTSDAECRREAVHEARPQVEAAILLDRGYR